MAYVNFDDSTLYIKGGKVADGSSTNQFFSLDLTQDWNVSNPPWKALNLGSGTNITPYGPYHSLVVSKDKKSLIYWGIENGVFVYDIANDSWVSHRPTPATTSRWAGLHAVASPYTGLIFIPSGANNGKSMMVYNPTTSTSETPPMPKNLTGVVNYSVAWSTLR
ncbi:hypothetical protein BGX26_002929, partial [Mortierella sp. AD094]